MSSIANFDANHFLIKSVQQHPDVIEKLNTISLEDIQIGQLIAEDGLKVDFYTQSKIPISFDVELDRLDDAADSYLNGVINAKKTLIDFGESDYKVDAKRYEQKAAELDYIDTFEKVLQKLLKLSVEADRLSKLKALLSKTILDAKSSIEDLKLRFSSGVGTITEVRQAQLSLMDLEIDHQKATQEYEVNLKTLDEEFNLSFDDAATARKSIKYLVEDLERQHQDVTFILEQELAYSDRSISRINHEKRSFRAKIDSLKSSNMPKLIANLTSVFYGSDKYEVYGDVKFEIPLYDSGLSDSKERGLVHQIKMQNDLIEALRNEKRLNFNDLSKRYQQQLIEREASLEKKKNLQEKLEHILQKLKSSGEGLLSKLQTTLKLAEVDRLIQTYAHTNQLINIDYLALNEQLLVKMLIKPEGVVND
ncbi:MAG: TolC family protein [Gammaproteobacteria bacterium]|nr:TolC family protein [Gammaproteobacteria bacterium]